MSEPNTPLEMDETKEFLSNPVVVEDKNAFSKEEDDVLDRLFRDTDDEQVTPSEPEVKKVPVTKEREKAIAILKRDGVPDEIVAGANDETLRAWADKAAKRQKDVDGYGKKMSELEKQLKTKAKPEPTESDEDLEDETDDVGDEPTTASPTETESEDPFAEVEELLGADAAKPFKAMRAELAELRKQQTVAAEQSLLIQVDSADSYFRSQYGDRSPDRDAVIAEMNRLGAANPGTYRTVMHLAEESYANLAGKMVAKADPRKQGQPTAARGVSRSERPQTPLDAEDAILDALMDGKTREEAMRLIRK